MTTDDEALRHRGDPASNKNVYQHHDFHRQALHDLLHSSEWSIAENETALDLPQLHRFKPKGQTMIPDGAAVDQSIKDWNDPTTFRR